MYGPIDLSGTVLQLQDVIGQLDRSWKIAKLQVLSTMRFKLLLRHSKHEVTKRGC